MLNRQTQSTILQCTHCHETMQLVRHIDITELPEIFVFHCSACQRAENCQARSRCLGLRPRTPALTAAGTRTSQRCSRPANNRHRTHRGVADDDTSRSRRAIGSCMLLAFAILTRRRAH